MEPVRKMVGLIPIRAGSKGIPNKNIRKMGNYPLFMHILLSAVACSYIDVIYVATDILHIETIINDAICELPIEIREKIKVIGRSPKTCEDDATTEMEMLEFADNYDFENVILLQATSPLTKTLDISKGIQLYYNGNYDSVLSATINRKFIWNYVDTEKKNAISLNYDVNRRPRRQNMELGYCENGAFYITSKKQLVSNKCRLSGRIGISVMEESSSIEVDEISDWIATNALLKDNYICCNTIEMVVLDCDGVMTDGKVFYSKNDVTSKAFNVVDGEGIELLRSHGIKVVVITKERTSIDGIRSKKLKIDEVHYGITDKWRTLKTICKRDGIQPEKVAYIGDDVSDFVSMKNVGMSLAPCNAQEVIKKNATICLVHNGGDGAVREAVNLILKHNQSIKPIEVL